MHRFPERTNHDPVAPTASWAPAIASTPAIAPAPVAGIASVAELVEHLGRWGLDPYSPLRINGPDGMTVRVKVLLPPGHRPGDTSAAIENLDLEVQVRAPRPAGTPHALLFARTSLTPQRVIGDPAGALLALAHVIDEAVRRVLAGEGETGL